MSYGEIFVEFEKFIPKEEFRNLVSTVADKLHMESPSDSSLKLVVQKGRGQFSSCCRIASSAGVFVGEATAFNPEGSIAKMENEILRQLRPWKRSRFRNEPFNQLAEAI